MLRINRGRFIGILCLVVFVYFVVFTDSGSSASNFRANTEAGIARMRQREKDLPLRGSLSDEDLTKKTNDELQGILNGHSQERLGSGSGKASDNIPQVSSPKSPTKADSKQKPDVTLTKSSRVKQTSKAVVKSKEDSKKANDDEDDLKDSSTPNPVQEKLDDILKSPLVIFSKSYCPHSKRAKHLLLEVYKILPKPVVIELDQLTSPVDSLKHDENDEYHKKTVGAEMQELLTELTGRRTVPNIVVGGKHSIGGNDNIWMMHESGTLQEEILKFGGKKITSIELIGNEA